MNKSLTLILIIILLSFGTPASAQNNAAEAKAAYLLAEEEFNAGKYEAAINYLNQASEKLGTANAKILYLRIMALQVLAPQSDKHFEALQQAISAFEKAPDLSGFNEEKQLEVMKLKMKLASDAGAMGAVSLMEKNAYEVMGMQAWRVGASIEQMKKADPGFFGTAKYHAFTEDWHTYQNYEPISRTSKSVTVKNGIVTEIVATPLFFFRDDKNYSTGHQLKNKLLHNVAENFVQKKQSLLPDSEFIKTDMTWENSRVQIIAYLTTHAGVEGKKKNMVTVYFSDFFVAVKQKEK